MNYTTITINDQKVGLKFGMASFRYLSEKFIDGISFENGSLNEIGISHIIFSGYYNNCIVKEIKQEYNFEYFVDFVEKNLNKTNFINEINEILKIWSENEFIKKTQDNEEGKKKNTRGKK